jgi:hypothetical protein
LQSFFFDSLQFSHFTFHLSFHYTKKKIIAKERMCSVQEPKEQAQKQHSKIGNEMRQH